MYRFLCGVTFSTPLKKYQRAQLLGYAVCMCLVWWEAAKLTFTVGVQFFMSTNKKGEFLLLYISAAFSVVHVDDFGLSHVCVVTSSLVFCILSWEMIGRIFSYGHILYEYLWAVCLTFLAHLLIEFIFFCLTFKVLCIFWLSDISFTNMSLGLCLAFSLFWQLCYIFTP